MSLSTHRSNDNHYSFCAKRNRTRRVRRRFGYRDRLLIVFTAGQEVGPLAGDAVVAAARTSSPVQQCVHVFNVFGPSRSTRC